MRLSALLATTVLFLTVTSGLLNGADAQATQTQSKYKIAANTEALVGRWGNWHYDYPGGPCTSDGIPQVQIVSRPQNGVVRVEEADVNTPDAKIKDSPCPNPFRGVRIYYRPNPGFIGTDQFVYTRKGDWLTNGYDRFTTDTITVQAQEVVQAPPGQTCSHHGQECVKGCGVKQHVSCEMRCQVRVNNCLQSGTYVGVWKTFTGLDRR